MAEPNSSQLKSAPDAECTMECDGVTFNVRFQLLVNNSDVFKVCLTGAFMEATTHHITITGFKPSSVKAMVDFMNGCADFLPKRIAEAPAQSLSDAQDSSSGSSSLTIGHDGTNKTANPTSAASKVETVSAHPAAQNNIARPVSRLHHLVDINGLGHYYDIRGLQSAAIAEIEYELEHKWDAKTFVDAVDAVVSGTSNTRVHELFAASAINNVRELVRSKVDMSSLAELHNFTNVALKTIVVNLNKMDKERHEHVRAQTQLHDALMRGAEANSEAVNKAIEKLKKTACCKHCGEEFNGYIENSSGFFFLVECKKCYPDRLW